MARTISHWILKTEPETYSYSDLEKDRHACWDGVRNYQARNNLKAMKKDDHVLIYHSVSSKEVVGTAVVVKEHYQDPTTDDDRWVAVDIAPVRRLPVPVPLSIIKQEPALSETPLVKHSRLSVIPLTKKQFEKLIGFGH